MDIQYSNTLYLSFFLLPLDMSVYPSISGSKSTPAVNAFPAGLQFTNDAKAPSAKDTNLNYPRCTSTNEVQLEKLRNRPWKTLYKLARNIVKSETTSKPQRTLRRFPLRFQLNHSSPTLAKDVKPADRESVVHEWHWISWSARESSLRGPKTPHDAKWPCPKWQKLREHYKNSVKGTVLAHRYSRTELYTKHTRMKIAAFAPSAMERRWIPFHCHSGVYAVAYDAWSNSITEIRALPNVCPRTLMHSDYVSSMCTYKSMRQAPLSPWWI